MLYVVPISENHLLTHDGVSLVGSLHCTLEYFAERCGIQWEQTYWLPDVYTNRYPRSNYQAHLSAAGKCKLEDAPKGTTEWKRRGQL